MSSRSSHSRFPVSVLVVALSVAVVMTGETRGDEGSQIVKGTIVLKNADGSDTIYNSPSTGCRTIINKHDKSYKFLAAVPRTTEYVRQWDCQYKDGENVNTWGTMEAFILCPTGSSAALWAYDRADCRCDGELKAVGGACKSEAEAAATPPQNPISTSSSPAKEAPKDDPCFSKPPADPDKPRPDEATCPRSARAYDIRRKLGVNGVSVPTAFAIAVSDGTLKNGKKVRLVTTNQKKIFETLRGQRATYLVPDEVLDETAPDEKIEMKNKWKTNRHAEDYAAAWFKAHDVVTKPDAVQMGSDPKACGGCTMMFKTHKWIHHERLDESVVKANP